MSENTTQATPHERGEHDDVTPTQRLYLAVMGCEGCADQKQWR